MSVTVTERMWQVFLNSLEVPYDWSPVVSIAPKLNYRPTMFLHDQGAFLDVMSVEHDEEDERATDRDESGFSIPQACVANVCHMPLFVTDQCPCLTTPPSDHIGGDYSFNEIPSFDVHLSDNCWDRNYMWCECPHCGMLGIEYMGRADRISCECPKSAHGDKGYNYDSERLIRAYRKVDQVFEASGE